MKFLLYYYCAFGVIIIIDIVFIILRGGILSMGEFPVSIPTLISIIAVVIILVNLASGYVKAPPDMAYIISGMKKKSKILIGKAGIRIPFLERLDKLNLRLIPIDVKTSNAVPTADYININVDATVNIKVSNDPEKLRLAAENFLNKQTDYIASVAREVLEGVNLVVNHGDAPAII